VTQAQDERDAEVERAFGSGHRLFVAPNRSGGWRCYVERIGVEASSRIVADTFRVEDTREAAIEATMGVVREKIERRARDSESAWNAVRDAAVARDAQELKLAIKPLASVEQMLRARGAPSARVIGAVLVSCAAGVSRSASVAYALLRVVRELPHDEAFERVVCSGGRPRPETLASAERWAAHRLAEFAALRGPMVSL